MKKIILVLVVLLGLGACGDKEENYPNKQISLVVQASPGGLSDQISRKIGDIMSKELGVPVVPVYKPGSIGSVGFQFVQSAKPDGYTIGHASVEIAMVRSLGYVDVGPDNVSMLGQAYTTIPMYAVHKDSPYTDFQMVVDKIKSDPGSIIIGTGGHTSFWHLVAFGVEQKIKAKFKYVPFDGSGPAVTALLGKHVDMVIGGPIEMFAGLESGDIRPLAIVSDSRVAAFPDVPTVKELGIDYSLVHWGGFMAPEGIPDKAKTELEKALKVAVNSEEFKNFVEEQGMQPFYRNSQDVTVFAKKQEIILKELLDKIQ